MTLTAQRVHQRPQRDRLAVPVTAGLQQPDRLLQGGNSGLAVDPAAGDQRRLVEARQHDPFPARIARLPARGQRLGMRAVPVIEVAPDPVELVRRHGEVPAQVGQAQLGTVRDGGANVQPLLLEPAHGVGGDFGEHGRRHVPVGRGAVDDLEVTAVQGRVRAPRQGEQRAVGERGS